MKRPDSGVAHGAWGVDTLCLVAVVFCLGGCSRSRTCDPCKDITDCVALCRCDARGDARACAQKCKVPDMTPAGKSRIGVGLARDLLDEVSLVRHQGGCCGNACFPSRSELVVDEQLEDAAQRHAEDMFDQGYVSHIALDGATFVDRIRRAGYRGCVVGENISAGTENVAEIVDEMLASEAHCLNILEGGYSHIGVGLAGLGGSAPHWVINFGGE